MLTIEDRLKRVEEKLESGVGKQSAIEEKKSQVPVIATIFAALAGLFTGAVTTYIQGRSGISLEETKFRYSLIQSALEGGNEKAAADKLAFLVKLGVLEDKEGSIAKLVANPSNIPVKTLEERLAEQGSQLAVLSQYVLCEDKGRSSGRRYIFDFATLQCLEIPQQGVKK